MMGKKEDKKIKATSINEDFFKQLVNFSSDDEEKPICIMGPDRSANKNKFRIYAYGGRIASIPFSKNGHIQLADSGYSEYVDNNDDKKVLEQKNIFEDKYWQVIISAAKKKFSNNKGTNKAERRIETELIKHSIANADKNGFIACDMEYSLFSYKDEKSGKNHTPRLKCTPNVRQKITFGGALFL